MDLVPRVTQGILKNSDNERNASLSREQVVFEDSEIILVCQGEAIRASFDNGENWKTTLEIGEDIEMIYLDKFHKRDRAFFEDIVGHLYVTGSQGREWMGIQKPLEIKESFPNSVETHPLARDYLLLQCDIEYGDYARGRFGDYDASPDVVHHGTECWFAFSSRHSALSTELLYGLHPVSAIDEQGLTMLNKRSLFYSPDLGRTTELVEELRNLSVSDLHILSSGILATTVEDIHNEICTEKLWFSTGGPFKEALLPPKLQYPSFGKAFEDDLGRVLLPVYTTENGYKGKFAHLLISEFSTFKLSQFDSILLNPEGRLCVEKFGICRGTVLEKLFGVLSEDGGAQTYASMVIHDNMSFNKDLLSEYMNAISFDNGNNWSGLKFLDPSNKYRRFYDCDIDDLQNCFLHISHYTHPKKNNSMAKLVMAKGTVTHSGSKPDGNQCMTFISRDAGVKWELAFTFPVYSVFTDVGDIIVAIPQEQEGFNDFCTTKIFFSSTQGKTWGQYEFEKPMLSDMI